ncbi:MAG: carcinine hydrolase/isopenicillin-N N-acyltransferase family protein [Candidatus Hodarchaeota archaeon]
MRELRTKNLLVILFLLLGSLTIIYPVKACTIFTVSNGDTVLFGGNEDNTEAFQVRIWFYPNTNGKYGKILLGYKVYNNYDNLLSGFNDQGLCIDMNAVPRTALTHQSEYSRSFFMQFLEECADVPQAQEWLTMYDVPFLENDQAHIADKTGNAMIVSLDINGEVYMTNKSGDYLISTNFNPARQEDLPGLPRPTCWRYELASELFNTTTNVTVETCETVLSRTALVPMYSYIFDLQNGLIYLYSHGDFERVAVLNVEKELAKGVHSYAIETLVAEQNGRLSESLLRSIIISILLILSVCGFFSGFYFFNLRTKLTKKNQLPTISIEETMNRADFTNDNLTTRIKNFLLIRKFFLSIFFISVLILVLAFFSFPILRIFNALRSWNSDIRLILSLDSILSSAITLILSSFILTLIFLTGLCVLSIIGYYALKFSFKLKVNLSGRTQVDETKTNRHEFNLKEMTGSFQPSSRLFLFVIIFAGLILLLKIFPIPISFRLMTDLESYWQVYITAIIIFSIGILFRPSIASIIGLLGLIAGEIVFCLLFQCGGELWFNIALSVFSFGISITFISLLRKKNEVLAMILGACWLFLGFYIPMNLYLEGIFNFGESNVLLISLINFALNFMLIPFALLLTKGLRIIFQTKYLDDLIFEENLSC